MDWRYNQLDDGNIQFQQYSQKQKTIEMKQQSELKIKNVQIEALFLLKQLTEGLPKKVYRQSITKVQEFILKQKDCLLDICASVFIKILFLQNKALLKLLEKNIYKKFRYEQFQVKQLIKILNRNNSICNKILVHKIQSTQILDQSTENLLINDYRDITNIFKNDINNKEFQNLTKQFCQIYTASIIFMVTTMKNYSYHIESLDVNLVQYIDKLTENLFKDHGNNVNNNYGFNPSFKQNGSKNQQKHNKLTLKTYINSIQLKIILCRLAIQKGEQINAYKIINEVIENILNIFYKLRICLSKLSQNTYQLSLKVRLIKKNKHYTKKVYKLLVISFILLIRAEMKMGKQSLAIQSMKIFHYIYENIDGELVSHFKKYLNPEIYIHNQYCQYRAQKFQLQKIIEVIFIDKKNQLFFYNNDDNEIYYHKKESFNTMTMYYNEKMMEFHQRFNKKQKKNQLKRIGRKDHNKIIESDQTEFINNKKNKKQNKTKNLCFSLHNSLGSNQNLSNTSNVNQANIQKNILNQVNNKRNSQNNYLNNFFNFDNMINAETNRRNLAFITQNKRFKKSLLNDKEKSDNFLKENQNNRPTQDQMNQAYELIGNIFESNHKTKLKKMRVIKNNIIDETENKSKFEGDKQSQQTVINLTNRILSDEKSYGKAVRKNVELLKQKRNNKLNLLNVIAKSDNQTEKLLDVNHINVIESEIDMISRENRRLSNLEEVNENRKSQRTSLAIKYKDRIKIMAKKTKIDMFIELLVENKLYLGMKKWSQKIQYLRKKQDLKTKMAQIRKTSSINEEINQPQLHRVNVSSFTEMIIKLTQEQIKKNKKERPLNYQSYKNQSKNRQKKQSQDINNQNNYKIGQKSIQMLMNKLQKQKQLLLINQTEQKNKFNRTERSSIIGWNKENTASKSLTKTDSSLILKKNRSNQKRWLCKFVL